MCVITHQVEFFGKVWGSVVNSQNCARATLAIDNFSDVAKLALAIAKNGVAEKVMMKMLKWTNEMYSLQLQSDGQERTS